MTGGRGHDALPAAGGGAVAVMSGSSLARTERDSVAGAVDVEAAEDEAEEGAEEEEGGVGERGRLRDMTTDEVAPADDVDDEAEAEADAEDEKTDDEEEEGEEAEDAV